jgi:hypothetical protein
MSTFSFTLSLPLTLDGFISTSFTAGATDSLSASESYGHSVQQPVDEQMPMSDAIPVFGFVNDAVTLIDDASGFVVGAQKTIYITDERFIIRHDFGG